MTDPQRKRLYFPAWQRAWSASWTLDRGLVRPLGMVTYPRTYTYEVAGMLAQRRVQRVTPEELRHAANAIAVQRERMHACGGAECDLLLDDANVSSHRLGPVTIELFLAWCDLLVSEIDLRALMRWEDPGLIVRERIIRHIEFGGAAGYAARLSADIHGTSDWSSLSLEALTSLHTLLCQRRNAWARNRAADAPVRLTTPHPTR